MALIPIEERLFRMDGETPVLRGSRCAACGKSFFPERRLCPICLEPVSNVELSRTGTLHSHTYVHLPLFGAVRIDSNGYGVGQIELPEGVRIQAVLVGDPGSFRIGMPMRSVAEVVHEKEGDSVVIFRFAADERPGA